MPLSASRTRRPALLALLAAVLALLVLVPGATASVGDRLPEFRECVDVCQVENCGPGQETPLPFHMRLLLWDCPSECDQTCQRIVTARRRAAEQPVVQFHGKWPFRRLLGIQEPASVLFSLGNLWAHVIGLRRLRANVPATYPLLPYYVGFAYAGGTSWVFSTLFHMRDFVLTERLDYFAAGASVLYGFFYTPIRVFRMDRWHDAASTLRAWSCLCVAMYVAHVGFLTLVRWDYTYNMAANVVIGVLQNSLWSWFSWRQWLRTRAFWTIWPGIAVAWVMMAMGLEMFDFAPLFGVLDAHSLWHLGTIGPTVIWYNFLIIDVEEDNTSKERFKD